MHMTDPGDLLADMARQNLKLLAWFSPAFPIGGFAFSHGLEWAQECGAVEGREALEGWLADLLILGSGRADAILIANAYGASKESDMSRLAAVHGLAAALQPSRERYLEATVQGQAFLTMVDAAYPEGELQARVRAAGLELARTALPVAVGMAGAAHGIALPALLVAALSGFVGNLSSAAVRLGLVGQTDGQRVIAALHPVIIAVATTAGKLTLDDLGVAALRSDLFSLQHETQYSRLFRS